MDFQELEGLRRNHPGWRLLAADNASLVVGFLHRTFIQPNLRTLPEDELTSRLDDYLFHLRELRGSSSFPRAAAEYLNDWASDGRGWLRKYYPPGSDEAHYDLTPATEKAIDWLSSLKQRPFVGTESRLRMVFGLLRQAELTAELERVREGHLLMMDETQVKDRFQQMAATAHGLLSDGRRDRATSPSPGG